ncbi:MAG: SufE family protein [Alphaproteobacteria bacterium]|nr:SufE family protein [Alphaproteobacteria bacterium]
MKYFQMKDILLSISDPVEKLEMVMEFGKTLEQMPVNADCKEMSGCMSLVKMCKFGDRFYGTADSSMVRGIVAIILAMVQDKTVQEIKSMDLHGEFAQLDINLGASRMNGVNSILGFFENL